MIKFKKRWACIFLMSLVFLTGGVTFAKENSAVTPSIRIGLFTRIGSVNTGSHASYQVIDGESGKILKKSVVGTDVVTASKGQIIFQGVSASKMKLVPHEGALLKVSGKQYHGEIELIATGSLITVVNNIDLESYLYGVLPAEMSPSWPIEALKSQAVAARTYALYTTSKKNHSKDGYDLCSTTHCQVYRGYDGEKQSSNLAVDTTRGEVMTYEGKPILAVFHSASGGYTENSENVWYDSLPYLRGVPDYDQKSTQYDWKLEITPASLASKLNSSNYPVGEIKEIRLSKMKKSPAEVEDRGISGRVTNFVIVGTKGEVTIKGSQLRTLLGLKSSCFDIYIKDSRDAPWVQVEEAQKGWTQKPNALIVIDGYGWGHGLGMSQWGAKFYAEEKNNKEGLYQEILDHYYTDITWETLY